MCLKHEEKGGAGARARLVFPVSSSNTVQQAKVEIAPFHPAGHWSATTTQTRLGGYASSMCDAPLHYTPAKSCSGIVMCAHVTTFVALLAPKLLEQMVSRHANVAVLGDLLRALVSPLQECFTDSAFVPGTECWR